MNPFKGMKLRGKLITGFLVIALIVGVVGGIGFLSGKKIGNAGDIVYEEKVPIAEAAMEASIAVISGRDAMGEYLLHEDLTDRETFRAEFEEFEEDYHMWYHAATDGTDSEEFKKHSGDRWAETQGGKRVIAVAGDSEVTKHFSEASGYHDQFTAFSHAMMLAHDAMLEKAEEKDKLVKELKAARKKAQGVILARDDVQLKFDFMGMKYYSKEYIFQYMDEKHKKEWFDSIKTVKASVAASTLEADSKEAVLKALDEYESLAVKLAGVIDDIKRLQKEEMAQMMALDEASAKVEEGMNLVVEVATDEMAAAVISADATKASTNILIVLGTMIAIALALGIGRLLSNSITRPLRELSEGVEMVSRGDLTKDIAVKTKDEIGELADSFRGMVSNLRGLVSQVQGSSQRVAATSQELAASSEEMTATTTQVSTTVQQIATGAQGQSRQVGKASEEVKRISEKAQKIADTAESIELITDNTNRVSKEAGDAARNAAARMEKIQTSVDQSAAVVKELGERSKRIGEIVDVITSIAEQTNLLALNAAIEAARAGEHGRGFAVVAEEVRKLAEGSAKAADEISGLIQSIQAETGKAVESMESGSKEVSEGVEVVDKALSALNNISSGVEEIAKWFQEISGATKDQTALTESVVKAMDEVAMKAEEAGAGTEEASAAAEEQTASMEEISSSAQELSALALQLQEAASRFKLNGASESVGEEVTKINEFPLNDAVNKVPEVVATNGGEKEP